MPLAESLFKEMIAETFPDLGKDMDIQLAWSSKIPNQFQPKEDFTETHYNRNVNYQRQRESWKLHEKRNS